MGLGFSEIDRSGACPSGKKKNTTSSMTPAIAASVTKTKCQPQALTIKLPTVGASSGDAPSINTSKEMIQCAFFYREKIPYHRHGGDQKRHNR